MNSQEAATKLGYSKDHISKLCRTGKLPATLNKDKTWEIYSIEGYTPKIKRDTTDRTRRTTISYLKKYAETLKTSDIKKVYIVIRILERKPKVKKPKRLNYIRLVTEYIKEHKEVTTKELYKISNASSHNIRVICSRLVKNDTIERISTGRFKWKA